MKRSMTHHRISANLGNLGMIEDFEGNYSVAQAHYEKSLAIKRQIGDQPGIAINLSNLGGVMQYRGAYDAAQQYQNESLAIRQAIGDRWGIGSAHKKLGKLLFEIGEYQKGLNALKDALHVFEQLNAIPDTEELFGYMAPAAKSAWGSTKPP